MLRVHKALGRTQHAAPLNFDKRGKILSVIELTEPMDDEALRTVQFFRDRLAELKRNWNDLETEGVTFEGWLGHDSESKLNTTGIPVSVHRLKGLYIDIDFRFFWVMTNPHSSSQFRGLLESTVVSRIRSRRHSSTTRCPNGR